MGITTLSLNRINKNLKPSFKILMIGCQNLYNTENYGQIAHNYFKDLGYDIRTIDILGCQGSEKADLREDLELEPIYDMINDCGCKEHIDGSLYQPFKNIHEACKSGGIMIHENPRFNHWPEHGQHYFSMDFYIELSKICGYELMEVCEEAAMSNYETGMNVCVTLKKVKENKFITEIAFNKIYKKHIHAK